MTYRERPEANFSNIKHLVNGTALDYHHALQNPIVPSRAMEIGTLIHAVYLEGADLNELVAIVPDDAPKKPTSAQVNAKKPSEDTLTAIAFWEKFREQTAGKIILGVDEVATITECVKNLESNQWLNRFMESVGDQVETAIYGTIEGVTCKGLIDTHTLAPLCVGDLKCLYEVGPREFARAVNDRHYDLQYALYCELMIQNGMCDVVPPWVWICQQTKQPHNLALYSASPEWFDNGRRKLTLCLDKLKRAQDSGQWESFPVEPIALEMPRWAAVKE